MSNDVALRARNHSSSASSREAPLTAFACLLRFFFAVPGSRVDLERVDEPMRGRGHVIDRLIEGVLVGALRSGRAAQLSNELERGGSNLVVGRGRFEVRKGFD